MAPDVIWAPARLPKSGCESVGRPISPHVGRPGPPEEPREARRALQETNVINIANITGRAKLIQTYSSAAAAVVSATTAATVSRPDRYIGCKLVAPVEVARRSSLDARTAPTSSWPGEPPRHCLLLSSWGGGRLWGRRWASRCGRSVWPSEGPSVGPSEGPAALQFDNNIVGRLRGAGAHRPRLDWAPGEMRAPPEAGAGQSRRPATTGQD